MNIPYKKIKITNHALERARQRLNLDIDFNNNSLLFETKIKELFNKSVFNDADGNSYHLHGYYLNNKKQSIEKIKFIATYENGIYNITTIIVK